MGLSDEDLYAAARSAAAAAHAPYSGLRVGAVLEDAAGRRHAGANVESASYGLTVCAERAALARAVADGARDFTRIAVARHDGRPIAPCGGCRQALAEFGTALGVIYRDPGGAVVCRPLADLLPDAFTYDP